MYSEQGPVEIIVKLLAEAVAPDGKAHGVLQECAARIGASLQPLHTSTSDPELIRYFVARADPTALSGILEQLRNCEGVEGAYAKPRGEAPKP